MFFLSLLKYTFPRRHECYFSQSLPFQLNKQSLLAYNLFSYFISKMHTTINSFSKYNQYRLFIKQLELYINFHIESSCSYFYFIFICCRILSFLFIAMKLVMSVFTPCINPLLLLRRYCLEIVFEVSEMFGLHCFSSIGHAHSNKIKKNVFRV